MLCTRAEGCFEGADWVEILDGDGSGFEDKERVGWVTESLKRGLSNRRAAMVYQVCVFISFYSLCIVFIDW